MYALHAYTYIYCVTGAGCALERLDHESSSNVACFRGKNNDLLNVLGRLLFHKLSINVRCCRTGDDSNLACTGYSGY